MSSILLFHWRPTQTFSAVQSRCKQAYLCNTLRQIRVPKNLGRARLFYPIFHWVIQGHFSGRQFSLAKIRENRPGQLMSIDLEMIQIRTFIIDKYNDILLLFAYLHVLCCTSAKMLLCYATITSLTQYTKSVLFKVSVSDIEPLYLITAHSME